VLQKSGVDPVGEPDAMLQRSPRRLSIPKSVAWCPCPNVRPNQLKEQSVEKRLVTRYAMRSAEDADENQRRVEGVFQELAAAQPDNVSYLVLRLADDSFVHLSFHDHGEDDVNPIASTAAFAHFQDGHADRRDGGVDQQTAELVGAYITTID